MCGAWRCADGTLGRCTERLLTFNSTWWACVGKWLIASSLTAPTTWLPTFNSHISYISCALICHQQRRTHLVTFRPPCSAELPNLSCTRSQRQRLGRGCRHDRYAPMYLAHPHTPASTGIGDGAGVHWLVYMGGPCLERLRATWPASSAPRERARVSPAQW